MGARYSLSRTPIVHGQSRVNTTSSLREEGSGSEYCFEGSIQHGLTVPRASDPTKSKTSSITSL